MTDGEAVTRRRPPERRLLACLALALNLIAPGGIVILWGTLHLAHHWLGDGAFDWYGRLFVTGLALTAIGTIGYVVGGGSVIVLVSAGE